MINYKIKKWKPNTYDVPNNEEQYMMDIRL